MLPDIKVTGLDPLAHFRGLVVELASKVHKSSPKSVAHPVEWRATWVDWMPWLLARLPLLHYPKIAGVLVHTETDSMLQLQASSSTSRLLC